MARSIRRLRYDTRGANYAEYLILVVVVAMVGLAGFRVLGETVQQRAECLGGRLAGDGAPCGEGEATDSGGASPTGGKKPGFDSATGAAYNPVKGDAFIKGAGDPTAIHPNDVTQGGLADCYVMSAMAAIATRNPDAIQEIIKKNADGTYTVTFREHKPRPWWQFWGSDWNEVKITVTPDFPTKDGQPVFAKPGDQNGEDVELWPMILEKAYAQYKGSYDAIGKGGWPGDPLSLMTGQPTESLGNNVTFDTINKKWQNGDAIAPVTISEDAAKDNPLFQSDGPLKPALAPWHVYYVVGVDPTAQTVTVRNPWGWAEGTTTLTMEQYNQAFAGTAATPVRK